MNELINMVSQKTGVTEEKAKMAVEVVIGYLKDKLPAPIASQVENAVGGENFAGKAGDFIKGAGAMFGKK
ncbi:MAG TPA: hypothetical protein VFD58_21405 [Blastocatellia bacterium]|nr:hypothetical protein [Blastocatellia bacterium]